MQQSRDKQANHFSADHANGADFCRALENEMGRLYFLGFLLTTRHDDAERCFVKTIEGIPENKAVFKEWVGTWTRHALIKNAIRSVLGAPRLGGQVRDQWWEKQGEPGESVPIEAITRLAPLEPFVFVMSVLERYSIKECSLLLDCSVETVIEAKTHALQAIGSRPPAGQINADLLALVQRSKEAAA